MSGNENFPFKQRSGVTPEPRLPVRKPSPSFDKFVETHAKIKTEPGTERLDEPFFYEGIEMPDTPEILKPATNQDAFRLDPGYFQPQLPAVVPMYRPADWWKDALTNDDLMLVLVLTLEGFSTNNIGHRLKVNVMPGLNELLRKPEIIYEMQRNIGGLFRGRVMPKAMKPTMAQGLIQSFVGWCNGEACGLTQLARVKEVEISGGDRDRLHMLAKVRQAEKHNICQQFGYSAEWVEKRVNDNIWRDLLYEWWEHGTINGNAIPEVGF